MEMKKARNYAQLVANVRKKRDITGMKELEVVELVKEMTIGRYKMIQKIIREKEEELEKANFFIGEHTLLAKQIESLNTLLIAAMDEYKEAMDEYITINMRIHQERKKQQATAQKVCRLA